MQQAAFVLIQADFARLLLDGDAEASGNGAVLGGVGLPHKSSTRQRTTTGAQAHTAHADGDGTCGILSSQDSSMHRHPKLCSPACCTSLRPAASLHGTSGEFSVTSMHITKWPPPHVDNMSPEGACQRGREAKNAIISATAHPLCA